MIEDNVEDSSTSKDVAKVVPIIRRRALAAKGNLRKREDKHTTTSSGTDVAESKKDENNDSNEDELGIDRQKLDDLKLLHSLKAHKAGISTESLSRGNGKDKKSGTEKDMKSNFSSQFNSRMDHGIQSTVPHEKIMEDFINEKLGVKAANESIEKPKTKLDQLYMVPDDLKVVGADLAAKKVKLDEEGVASSWSTGIAEVQLPMSYKLQNIEATERAANNALKYSQSMHGKSGGFHRFQINESQITMPMGAAEFNLSNNTQGNESNSNKRPMKSTDDLAVQRYKKQLSGNRR